MWDEFDSQVLFDFTGEHPERMQWYSVDDRVMGGTSQSIFTTHDSGVGVFQGRVSAANGGGFASVRSEHFSRSLAAYQGIALHVLGDGHRYHVSLTTSETGPSLFYLAGFYPAPDEWFSFYLPFHRFRPKLRGQYLEGPRLNPGALTSLGFMITGGQTGPFYLQIDHIWAFHADELHEEDVHDRVEEFYL